MKDFATSTGRCLLLLVLLLFMPPTLAGATCTHPAGPMPFGLLGDLNENGARNVADAMCGVLSSTWALAGSQGSPPGCLVGSWKRADIDCSGVATVSDVQLIVNLVLTGGLGPGVDPINAGCAQACAPCHVEGEGSCLIGSCVPEGQHQPGQACQVCSPAASEWSWTSLPNTAPCEGASGKRCSEGICVVVPPDAPAIALVEPGVESATVHFSAPGSNGGSAVTEYIVTCTPAGGGVAEQESGPSSPIEVTGLIGGVSYQCAVTATNAAGEGPASTASAPFIPLTAGPPTFSSNCLDWSTLGWASREACLRDGRWHQFGTYAGGTPMPGGDLTLLNALVASGADLKVKPTGSTMAIIDVERIITDCDAPSRLCLYARRERGTGLATLGMFVTSEANNGNFWLGSERAVTSLATFFQGTDTDLATGTMGYTLYVRPGRWRLWGTISPSTPLSAGQLSELKSLGARGARFKAQPSVGGVYANILRVVRVIPDCGAACMWLYLRREHNNGGERTFGFQVGTSGDHGAFWIGDPVNVASLGGFLGGTSSGVASGNWTFNLYAEDAPFPGEPSYSNTCSDWVDLGWDSKAECLEDGRFHTVGTFTAGTYVADATYNELYSASLKGADLRYSVPAIYHAVVDVERFIPSCETNRMCYYARRERADGWATLGGGISKGAPYANGGGWLGTELAVTNLASFFTGTDGSIGSTSSDYSIHYRPGSWHAVAAGGGGVPLGADLRADIRALAERGADFKLRATTGGAYSVVVKVDRVIPDVTQDTLWFYALREHSDAGYRTLGVAVSSSTNNGDYWIGSPFATYSGISAFAGATQTNVATGTFQYALYASEPCMGCTGTPCSSSAQCLSGVCGPSGCAPRACTNGAWDAAETGPDCGGPCAPCVGQADSCLGIQTLNPTAPSDYYVIDPDGAGPLPAHGAWCDMTTDGGGWTLLLNVTRTNNAAFASNYSNYVFLDQDTPVGPSPTTAGRKLQALSDVPFTEIAALSIDGAAFVPNCKWTVDSGIGYRANECNWDLKVDLQGYVGLQSLGTACYVADIGGTGVVKNYASAGPGATNNAIHTQWSTFIVSNDGYTPTAPDFTASKYLSIANYNSFHQYFNIENCRSGSQQNFNSVVIAVR